MIHHNVRASRFAPASIVCILGGILAVMTGSGCKQTRAAPPPHTRADLCHFIQQAAIGDGPTASPEGLPFASHQFHAAGGRWVRHCDLTADKTAHRLVHEELSVRDATISVELSWRSGDLAPASAGILVRMREPDRGLALYLEEGEGLGFTALRDGRETSLARCDFEFKRDRWYPLTFSLRGDRLSATLEGRLVLEATAAGAPREGRIGLFEGHTEAVVFRNLTVDSGSGATAVPLDFPGAFSPTDPSAEARNRIRQTSSPFSCRSLIREVPLENDYRTSFVLPPDSEFTFPLRSTGPGRLQFELGVLPTPQKRGTAASRLAVIFQPADGPPRTLSRFHLSDVSSGRTWKSVVIDLDGATDSGGRILLRNRSIGETAGVFVALANPILHFGTRSPRTRPPNLVLVTVDTLRADHLGTYGYERETSPFLDALAERSILFEDVIAQSSWTKTSMASLLTSTYPETNKVRGVDDRLAERFTTLAEVFRQHGYFTAGVQVNPWIHPRFDLTQGFAEYHLLPAAAAAAEVNEHALEILRRRDRRPFFLYLHYMDVHHPYSPTDAHNRFGPEPPDRYDGEIRYLDAQLAALHESLEQEGLLTRTLFVVTADHGEEFGDHGGKFHGKTLYREQLHVPWLIHWPERFAGGRRLRARARNIDIAPTLLDLMEFDPPPGFQGTSLKGRLFSEEVPAGGAMLAFAQVGLNDMAPDLDLLGLSAGKWKYIKDRKSPWLRLFDQSADPGEQADVAGAFPEVVKELERQCQAFLRRSSRPFTTDKATLDEDLTNRLRSLGYLQ